MINLWGLRPPKLFEEVFMFEIGQQVICINDSTNVSEYMQPSITTQGGLDGLTKGCIYTIRDIYHNLYVTNYELLRLEGIYREQLGGSKHEADPGYLSIRFRPVRKTDISIFTEILTNIGTKEDA